MSDKPVVVAVTGASGAVLAKMFVESSPRPVILVFSKWGETVYRKECGDPLDICSKAMEVVSNDDLSACISSGSVPTAGMVIVPCSCNTLGEVAAGLASTVISRAAHCHLKERRRLVVCLRESPLSHINLLNCVKLSESGAIIMPVSPPFYMSCNDNGADVTLRDLFAPYIERVHALFGKEPEHTYKDVR